VNNPGLLLHIIPTALDLLFVVACIGFLATALWVIPQGVRKGTVYFPPPEKVKLSPFYSLWRLLGLILAGLTLVSVFGLFQRTMEMSGLPWSEAFSDLPLVLSKTHFGMTWLVRITAVVVLWFGWWRGRRKKGDSLLSSSGKSETVPFVPWAMMLAAACIAWSVSASSHAADWGDFTLPEWVSWLHIMAGSMWVGGLLAFTLVVRRRLREQSEGSQAVFAAYAAGLSRLAGIALVLVMTTGVYNVWRQLDHFRDLWSSGYGRIILFKLMLVGVMAWMGALSRYFNLPFLCHEADVLLPARQTGLPLRILRWLNPSWMPHKGDALAHQFGHRVMMEAWLALGVLACAALLGHAMPPKKHADAVYMNEDKAPVIARVKPVAISMAREGHSDFITTPTFPIKPGTLKRGSNPV